MKAFCMNKLGQAKNETLLISSCSAFSSWKKGDRCLKLTFSVLFRRWNVVTVFLCPSIKKIFERANCFYWSKTWHFESRCDWVFSAHVQCPYIFDRKSQRFQFFSNSGVVLFSFQHHYNEEEAFGAKNRFLTRAIQSFTITFALGSLPHWRTIIVSSYCEFCHWTRRSRLNDAFCNSTGCSTPFVGIGELLEKSIEKWKYWVDVGPTTMF